MRGALGVVLLKALAKLGDAHRRIVQVSLLVLDELFKHRIAVPFPVLRVQEWEYAIVSKVVASVFQAGSLYKTKSRAEDCLVHPDARLQTWWCGCKESVVDVERSVPQARIVIVVVRCGRQR